MRPCARRRAALSSLCRGLRHPFQDPRKNGVGILLISEDLDEVVALADRVQAIYKGRLSPPVATDEIDAKAIGLMMAGMWEE